jgi:Glycosyl hydrolase 36 superfamily, catalytic domain
MNRRQFLSLAGMGAFSKIGLPKFATAARPEPPGLTAVAQASKSKAYGSGYFGEWITDQFGLPAYRYTCDQVSDPKALSPTHKQWRGATDQTHQVGNDRLIAAVSNFGYVQVRQDEGSPKFLNDYSPEHGRFGGGIGFLTDGSQILSTYYSGHGAYFERILGEGYFRKTVTGKQYAVDQVIFAPFGDDPVLISAVTVENHGGSEADLRWVEYWGCHNYQFSFRSWMEANALRTHHATDLRREFGGRFAHEFGLIANGAGLVESQRFLGRSPEDDALWEQVQASLKNDPSGFFGGPVPDFAPGTSMEDLYPPRTFLASLDAPGDGFATDAAAFFGSGGIDRPSGLSAKLNNDLGSSGPSSAFLLERRLKLGPQEGRTLFFMYGYLPQGFALEKLVAKYAADPANAWSRSSAAWKTDGLRLNVPAEPWVERETSWHNYYLRSSLTYDSFFREPILSQGHVYQYLMGFQGAARDPLQHALPFVFSNPAILKGVIRYTLKEIQPDGTLPYAIVGSGVPMPAIFHPSDQEMWLLWAASEYVLATRDKTFLHEQIPMYPHQATSATDTTIRELLRRTFTHLVHDIGVGRHGLMRLSNGDWNDEVVVMRGSSDSSEGIRKVGESVLNAAMASYVLDHYARMLRYAGDTQAAEESRAVAAAQREAVRACWQGKWFRRAWLGTQLGWLGDDHVWLEPQPWSIIGGAATPEQRKTLLTSLNELVRDPSPIGAMVQSEGDSSMRSPVGTMTNGGIWPSINGTLIWALALENGASAWDEWKKNSLALHAEKYPEVWYGTWSGPDTYNSVLSKHPGQTMFVEKSSDDHSPQSEWGMNWTDFPVMNLHPHAWPLYSAAKLLGIEFHESGLSLQPDLPLTEYDLTSALLGFKKFSGGYSGWYAPSTAGRWTIALTLSDSEMVRVRQLRINGATRPLPRSAKTFEITGESSPGAPLRWEIGTGPNAPS